MQRAKVCPGGASCHTPQPWHTPPSPLHLSLSHSAGPIMLPLSLSLLQRWRKPDDAITDNIELQHHRGGSKSAKLCDQLRCTSPPPHTTLNSALSTLRVPGVNLTTSARLTQRTKMCAKQIIGRKTNINNGQQEILSNGDSKNLSASLCFYFSLWLIFLSLSLTEMPF